MDIWNILTSSYGSLMFLFALTYIAVLIGLIAKTPEYIQTLETYIKIYISLFLLIRFNPFVTIKFTELDRKIVFSSALIVLTTSVLNNTIQQHIIPIRQYIHDTSSAFLSSFHQLYA